MFFIYNFVDDFSEKMEKKKNFYINGNSAFIDWIRCNYRVKIYNKIGEKMVKKITGNIKFSCKNLLK